MKIRIDGGSSASADVIESIERILTTKLSTSYRSFLQSQDGGEPEHNYFEVGPRNGSGVRQFIPATEILRERAYIDGISGRAYPIAYDGCGNFILIDEAENGAVFFWDHETNNFTLIAADFSAFLESLEPSDTEGVKLKPGQVKRVWIDPEFRRQHPELFKPRPTDPNQE